MFMSVAILAVLGILVVVSILRGDDPPIDPGEGGERQLQIEGDRAGGGGGTASPATSDGGTPNGGSPAAGEGPSSPEGERVDGGAQSNAGSSAAADDRVPPQRERAAWQKQVEAARQEVEGGRIAAGIAGLSKVYRASTDPAQRRFLRKPLLEWSKRYVMFPMEKTGLYARHRVEPGDNFIRIANKVRREMNVNTSAMFIQDINRISDPRRLRLGHRLFIPARELSIDVTMSEFRLDVYYGECLALSYEVGIGKEGTETPVADFVVGTKIDEPDWFFDGKTIPYGDPENELGDRWIGIEHDLYTGFGIHGTNDESTIGKAVSRGCVRLRNKDIIALYRMIPPKAKVRIRR